MIFFLNDSKTTLRKNLFAGMGSLLLCSATAPLLGMHGEDDSDPAIAAHGVRPAVVEALPP